MTEPASAHYSSASTATLPIDQQIDGLFEGLFSAASEEQQAHFQREIDGLHPDLRDLGLGRKLIRLARELERVEREKLLFLGECEIAERRIRENMTRIDLVMDAEALAHRRAGHGNSREVIGVGVWTTKRAPARWEINNALAMETMDADQQSEFTELPLPKPPERKIKGPDFRRFLDEQYIDDKGEVKGELPLGVARVETTIGVTHDLYS